MEGVKGKGEPKGGRHEAGPGGNKRPGEAELAGEGGADVGWEPGTPAFHF